MNAGGLRAGALVGWSAFLIVATAVLHDLGGGVLSVPPPPAWNEWLGQAGPAVAAASLLRLGTLAAGWYLLATTVLNVAVSGAGPRRIVRVVEMATPRLVLRVVHGVVGASIAASATTAMAAADPAATDDPPVMRRHHDADPEPTEAVIMRRLPDEPAVVENSESPPAAHPRRTVQPGDHFWSIAESELVAARSRPVSDPEIDPYWRQLVAANLGEVPHPDLLFPGQVVHVPPVPRA